VIVGFNKKETIRLGPVPRMGLAFFWEIHHAGR